MERWFLSLYKLDAKRDRVERALYRLLVGIFSRRILETSWLLSIKLVIPCQESFRSPTYISTESVYDLL